MRLEPITERFELATTAASTDPLGAVDRYATRRGKVLDRSPDAVIFVVGSAFTFRMLGTSYERGRRSIPVKVTVSLAPGRAHGRRLLMTMESQERGWIFRAPWMDAAYADRFRDLYEDLRQAVDQQDSWPTT